jgi:hypothetical protein
MASAVVFVKFLSKFIKIVIFRDFKWER